MKSEMMGNAALVNEECLSSSIGIRRPLETKHRKRKRRINKDDEELLALREEDQVVIGSSSSSDEKEEVEKKIMALQQIVPGGESLDNVDNLFETTAAYILDLQNQVKAMKLLANFFELLQKHKTKLGGN